MKSVKKLFKTNAIYKIALTDGLFVKAMKENAVFQYENCTDYKCILDEVNFSPYDIETMSDLIRLPFLPTLYFKHHKLFSVSDKKLLIKATSSGTSGSKSEIGFDLRTLLNGLEMVIKVGKYHRLLSLQPVHYLIFGYKPSKDNRTAVSKTAFGFTFFAPALSRTYAIQKTKEGYNLDLEHMKKAFIKFSNSKVPIRTIGFPAYTYFLLKKMKESGIHLKMPKGSMITIAGGWKQFYTQKVNKEDFYALVQEVLEINEDHVVEFFGAVEHPILYTDCREHHFHIPVYSRIIIRDPDTFESVSDGMPGLINLLTPMVTSVPLLSIMTDDLGIIHTEKCSCGEPSPWVEIIGRVGIKDIVTCAAGAEEMLKEQK